MTIDQAAKLARLRARIKELPAGEASHARGLLKAVERARVDSEASGLDFGTPHEDKFFTRLRAENTPFFASYNVNHRVPSPGTLTSAVTVDNPDPIAQLFLYVHLFVGPAAATHDTDRALALADPRFPRATEPRLPGLLLAPRTWGWVSFTLPISSHIEESNYFVNLVLMQVENDLERSRTLDRATMVVAVRDRP